MFEQQHAAPPNVLRILVVTDDADATLLADALLADGLAIDEELATEAIKQGVVDFLFKDRLTGAAMMAVTMRSLAAEGTRSAAAHEYFGLA